MQNLNVEGAQFLEPFLEQNSAFLGQVLLLGVQPCFHWMKSRPSLSCFRCLIQ